MYDCLLVFILCIDRSIYRIKIPVYRVEMQQVFVDSEQV